MKEQDKIIQELLDKVKAKEDALKKINNYSYKTNLMFPYSPHARNQEKANLNLVQSVEGYIEVLRKLNTIHNGFNEAAKQLGVDIKFIWGNFSYQDWRDDIQHKVDCLNLKRKKKELDALKIKLSGLMSKDAKIDQELTNITKLLNDY